MPFFSSAKLLFQDSYHSVCSSDHRKYSWIRKIHVQRGALEAGITNKSCVNADNIGYLCSLLIQGSNGSTSSWSLISCWYLSISSCAGMGCKLRGWLLACLNFLHAPQIWKIPETLEYRLTSIVHLIYWFRLLHCTFSILHVKVKSKIIIN